ncbi:hypothetical protein BC940DRAFT_66459 [Gongronella butleri]|nr:hypothetical protein BC940DRAFT_66459 [Gongronella butleri]
MNEQHLSQSVLLQGQTLLPDNSHSRASTSTPKDSKAKRKAIDDDDDDDDDDDSRALFDAPPPGANARASSSNAPSSSQKRPPSDPKLLQAIFGDDDQSSSTEDTDSSRPPDKKQKSSSSSPISSSKRAPSAKSTTTSSKPALSSKSTSKSTNSSRASSSSSKPSSSKSSLSSSKSSSKAASSSQSASSSKLTQKSASKPASTSTTAVPHVSAAPASSGSRPTTSSSGSSSAKDPILALTPNRPAAPVKKKSMFASLKNMPSPTAAAKPDEFLPNLLSSMGHAPTSRTPIQRTTPAAVSEPSSAVPASHSLTNGATTNDTAEPMDIDEPPQPQWQGAIKVNDELQLQITVSSLQDDWNLTDDMKAYLSKEQQPSVLGYIPFKMFHQVASKGNFCIMDMARNTQAMTRSKDSVQWSQYANWLRINGLAALVYDRSRPTELVLMCATDNMYPGLLTTPPTKNQRTAIVYVKGIEPNTTDGIDRRKGNPDLTAIDWMLASNALQFPPILDTAIKDPNATFLVHGSTPFASLVQYAIDARPANPEPSEEMIKVYHLCDRSDPASLKLLNEAMLKSNDHTFYEFGAYTNAPIIPTMEAFPKRQGGYVTTDIDNIVANPEIVDMIVNAINMRNSVAGREVWKFVLHPQFLKQMAIVPVPNSSVNSYALNLMLLMTKQELWTDGSYMTDDNQKEVTLADRGLVNTAAWYDEFLRNKRTEAVHFEYMDALGQVTSTIKADFPLITFTSLENYVDAAPNLTAA